MQAMKTLNQSQVRMVRTVSLGLSGLVLAGMLTGCGLGNRSAPTTIAGAHLKGSVHGGQQPVVGATLQLYAATTGGYGQAATSLLTPGAFTTGGGGYFDLMQMYTCPSADSQVYLVATGGNSGYTTNANLALMAALGSCGNLTEQTNININELTTIASVYALAPFMTGLSSVSTSATNVTGLDNAFADVNTLVDTNLGVAPGPSLPAGATIPTAELNTLADIIASCVNSSGGTASNTMTSCGTLFAAANPGGTSGTAPTDTITAALNIAHYPALNVMNLYGLANAQAPFQPTLGTQPSDFTIAETLTANLSGPSGLAADASGNIYVSNGTGGTVAMFTHTGTSSVLTTGLSNPSSIAVDQTGYIWTTNQGDSSVSKISTGGMAQNFTGGSMNAPMSIAFDASGTAWVANNGNNSVTTISSDGSTLTNYTPSGLSSPVAIAVNPH